VTLRSGEAITGNVTDEDIEAIANVVVISVIPNTADLVLTDVRSLGQKKSQTVCWLAREWVVRMTTENWKIQCFHGDNNSSLQIHRTDQKAPDFECSPLTPRRLSSL
jgi:hypothetical protein